MTTSISQLVSNHLITELNRFIQHHPRAEKILIVPAFALGNQVLEHLARSGTPWLNFRVATTQSLALSLIEDILLTKELELLSGQSIGFAIDKIFRELAAANKLKYFKRLLINKGLVAALTRSVSELRLAGLNANSLPNDAFINEAKKSDLEAILLAYESFLKTNRYIDKAGMLQLALARLAEINEPQTPQYAILERHYLSGLEREFVKKISQGQLSVLKEDQVFGLEAPADVWPIETTNVEPEARTNIERLKWLFASAKAPKPLADDTIQIFSASGYRNEIRELMRRILKLGCKIDEVEIIYTNSLCYRDRLYALCDKLKLPATFSEGLPAGSTNSGRVFLGFLSWIKNDFHEKYLRKILEANGLNLESAAETGQAGTASLGYLLRTSGVGWGRDRYGLILSRRSAECCDRANKSRQDGEEDEANRLEARAQDYNILQDVCDSLLKLVPEEKAELVDFTALCTGCLIFLNKRVRCFNQNDQIFVKVAVDQIAELSRQVGGNIHKDDALEKLLSLVTGLTVASGEPAPGHLHLAHYRQGGRSGRPYTFVVGLDENKFPNNVQQGPILLDKERSKLSPNLELSTAILKKNIFDLAGLLAGLRGAVTFSFTAFDIVEERAVFPSSLLLQVYRVQSGNPIADYSTFLAALGEPIRFTPGLTQRLDETDLWLSKLVKQETLLDGIKSISELNPSLGRGLKAEEARDSTEFTVYDGKVSSRETALDPRLTQEVMSCSRLEKAAKCPYAYFIQYVLKVKLPDETEKDVNVWLQSFEKGSLLHKVYEKYITQLIALKTKPDHQEQDLLLATILQETIQIYKESIPPPGQAVFEQEKTQLERDVQIFAQVNRELGSTPIACEFAFGPDKPNPVVTINLGDQEQILLRGSIDRVDRLANCDYVIIDYKTGSSYGYNGSPYIKGGEQLQHCLYAYAAEQLLKKSGIDTAAKVGKAGYVFPSEKVASGGKGSIFLRPVKAVEDWQLPVHQLLELIGSGTFLVNPEDNCKFCDYVDVCGGVIARQRMQGKIVSQNHKELRLWEELKSYE